MRQVSKKKFGRIRDVYGSFYRSWWGAVAYVSPIDGHRKQAGRILPACDSGNARNCDLLGGALARFDLDYLAATVLATGWANVVSLLHAAALTAWHESRCGEEVMAASVALAMTTDFLFWKSTHFNSPDPAASAAFYYVYRQPGETRTRGAIAPRYPAIVVMQRIDHR